MHSHQLIGWVPPPYVRIAVILEKHKALAKLLKQTLDKLKPQQFVRVRYQEESSKLDLDVAIRSLIDYKCGAQPDPRINMSQAWWS